MYNTYRRLIGRGGGGNVENTKHIGRYNRKPGKFQSISKDETNSTLSIEHQDGLDSDVAGAEAVMLEHHFNHFLAVLLRVHGWLGEHDLGLGWLNLQLLWYE